MEITVAPLSIMVFTCTPEKKKPALAGKKTRKPAYTEKAKAKRK